MKLHNLFRITSLFVATFFLAGSGCPLIPNIEEKIVELAVGASITLPFEARGIINDKSQVACFFLDEEIDLRQILDDAGVDVSNVESITLSGVSEAIAVADPNPSRMIVNSDVSIAFGDDGPEPLVEGFSGPAGAVRDFETVDLNPAGVDLINTKLAELLASVQNNSGTSIEGCATWSGQSTPLEEDTNFDWEIRLDLTVVGTITVDVPN